ncbi:MAG: magnesium transporter [Chlamydiales bacterium]
MKIDMSKRFTQEMLLSPVKEFMSHFRLVFSTKQSVGDILEKLYSMERRQQNEYFYIVDEEDVLQGIVTSRDLLYNRPNMQLMDIVDTEVLKIHDYEPLEKALQIFSHHQLLALPVVDHNNRFVGIIEVLPHDDDAFHRSKRLHAKTIKEDIFQFIGFSIEQRKMASTLSEFRYRMPWLLCNLFGGLICALIGEAFSDTLVTFVILALFIPLVLSLSESVAVQSMTISLRFLHMKKIYWSQIFRRCDVEWKTSFLLGVASSILIAGFYFTWSLHLMPIFAIGISVVISMIFSAIFGALFPIFLHMVKLDPKVAAGPVVLSMADVITCAIYYGVTTLLLM